MRSCSGANGSWAPHRGRAGFHGVADPDLVVGCGATDPVAAEDDSFLVDRHQARARGGSGLAAHQGFGTARRRVLVGGVEGTTFRCIGSYSRKTAAIQSTFPAT
jgi:hypothetical protein